MNPKLTYLLLNLGSLAFPLVRSFEPLVRFWSFRKGIFLGIFASALYFIPLDAWFTAQGWWGFNPAYFLGPALLGLPLEEWLFFICIPYACLFIYACVCRLTPIKDGTVWTSLGWVIVVISLLTAALNHDKAYTFYKVGIAGLVMAAFLIHRRGRGVGNFLVAYLITEIPFFIVNGILTSLPVVWYNNAENLSIRMNDILPIGWLNIPIEDNIYSLQLLLVPVWVLEAVHGHLDEQYHTNRVIKSEAVLRHA